MSLKKIAELSGVSVSTVSKSFSGSDEISKETKEKVIDAAKKLGCYEKYMKEKYPEKIIAVICPEINSECYSSVLSCLDEEITKRNAVMTISQYNFEAERAERLFKYYSLFKKVDGIITFSKRPEGEMTDIPAVLFGGRDDYLDSVEQDNTKAIDETVKYLKETGHKKIAFIGEELTKGKKIKFIDSMKANGMAVMDKYVICEKKRFYDAGYEGMEHFFSKGDIPDAVVAAYDYIAIGAIRAIKAHGLKVPEDISVIGMDNISACEDLDVPLTTITGKNEEVSRVAVDMLFERFKNNYSKRKSVKIEMELIKRKSVKNRKLS